MAMGCDKHLVWKNSNKTSQSISDDICLLIYKLFIEWYGRCWKFSVSEKTPSYCTLFFLLSFLRIPSLPSASPYSFPSFYNSFSLEVPYWIPPPFPILPFQSYHGLLSPYLNPFVFQFLKYDPKFFDLEKIQYWYQFLAGFESIEKVAKVT